jgi:hypothetical protein
MIGRFCDLESRNRGGGPLADYRCVPIWLGDPIEGAEIVPHVEYKKRPGDDSQFRIGARVRSDGSGAWQFKSVPDSLSSLHVEIQHPKHPARSVFLPRAKYEIQSGAAPTAQIVLPSGIVVTGTVTAESGEPIPGALVRSKRYNQVREAMTGADGQYRLLGCPPAVSRIVVSAPGMATDMKELTPSPDMGPVDFTMQPGGHLRIRVVDGSDKPIAHARIFPQEWRGDTYEHFELDHFDRDTDDSGVVEWNEAPLDGFKADISGRNATLPRLTFHPRPEEYVIRVPNSQIVSGSVVDAQTEQPIDEFVVLSGVRNQAGDLQWPRSAAVQGHDGTFELRRSRDYGAVPISVEAVGYHIGTSREIRFDEGNVRLELKLEPGTEVTSVVRKPSGEPAVGALVALSLNGSWIEETPNRWMWASEVRSGLQVETDEAGRFRFPMLDTEFELAIQHDTGWARLRSGPDSLPLPQTIDLQPWARVEGTYREGPKAIDGVYIVLLGNHRWGMSGFGPSQLPLHQETTTGPDGRFVFDRVIPGSVSVSNLTPASDPTRSPPGLTQHSIQIQCLAGQTMRADLGDTERVVVKPSPTPDG